MRDLAHCVCILLLATFASASAASAEGPEEESEFVRPGFYAGFGGTAAFPRSWNNDIDDDLNERATDLANGNAEANRDAIPSSLDLVPLSVAVDDTALEEARLGLNGVVGYRAGQRAAFELEAEWIVDSARSSLAVTSVSDLGMGTVIPQASSGAHSVEVETIWTITANAKVFAPLTGRYQPFVKVGIGLHHAKLVTDITTSGLTATDEDQMIVVPADFRLRSSQSNLDGSLRVGAGMDFYATPNIVVELGAGYVVPFSEAGSLRTEYVAVQWRLTYRF